MKRIILIGTLFFTAICLNVAYGDTKEKVDILEHRNNQLKKEIEQMKEVTKVISGRFTFDKNESDVAVSKIRIFEDVNDGEFKCYEDYTKITDSFSDQWKLQEKAYTGVYGIRQIGGYYCVAMGSHFGTKIGQKYTLEMANGSKIPVILADQKADCDTDAENVKDSNGCIVEFVVDETMLPTLVKRMGDISFADHEFYGPIKNIVVEP